jgi:hypothetical protein
MPKQISCEDLRYVEITSVLIVDVFVVDVCRVMIVLGCSKVKQISWLSIPKYHLADLSAVDT